jgi:hypothetical protein
VSRHKISCPDCGLALVEMPDFFGMPRLAHPQGECVRPSRTPETPRFTTSTCAICEKLFAQKVKGWRRITCSRGCLSEMQNRNLARGRAKLPNVEIPKVRNQWAERYRRKWQKRAEELDRKYAA